MCCLVVLEVYGILICVLTQSVGANILWAWFVVDFDFNMFVDFNFVGVLVVKGCCE